MKLNKKEKEKIIERYSKRYAEEGYSPATLGWGKGGRQHIRFGLLAGFTDIENTRSVLDVGCGFADFYEFISKKGFKGDYVGVELVDVLAKEALNRHPEIEILEEDFLSTDITGSFDLAIASGLFNAKCHDDMYGYIEKALKKMLSVSKLVAVDFMSTHVDYQQELAFHADPEKLIKVASSLTKRFALRHDYMPYELALFLYADDVIAEDNVFSGFIEDK